MKIRQTGVFFIGECDIQANMCTAKTPSAITAIKTEPSGNQINVCRNCLEVMVRDGEWEIPGAKITRQVDLAGYDSKKHLQLVVEVKMIPRNQSIDITRRAQQIRRNLTEYSGIPGSRFLMVAFFPRPFFLWSNSDRTPPDALPDYTFDVFNDLKKLENEVIPSSNEFDLTERVVSLWLEKTLTKNEKAEKLDDLHQNAWLYNSGLYEALVGGTIIRHVNIEN